MNTATQPDGAPAVRIADAAFAYRRGPVVLQVDEFAVAGGERVFIAGASGSGKSTLLALIGGVVAPAGGVVEVLGERLSGLAPAARDRFRADHIGFIFQMFNLLPYLSVLDNVLLPCRFSPRRAEQAGGRAGLGDEAKRLLSRLGFPAAALRSPAADLSVGQQQRVAAARALIGRPRLVIADEPTSALDTASRERFLRLLLGECAAAGATVLFVSHDEALTGHFTRQVTMAALNRAWVAPDDD